MALEVTNVENNEQNSAAAEQPKMSYEELQAAYLKLQSDRESERLQHTQEVADQKAIIEAQRLSLTPKVQNSGRTVGEWEVARQKAINNNNGLARWNTLTFEQRANALGLSYTETSDAELSQLFGKNSDSLAANSLSRQNPARYTRLRMLAREKGLL